MDPRPYSARLIAAAFCLFAAACSGTEEQASPSSESNLFAADIRPAHGDRLVSASIGDASNLIPMIAGDASSHEIAGMMYLSLLKYDRNIDLTGQLAERWEIAADQMSITFYLRKGLKWSDGVPFTAEDCAFTLALMQDEHTQSAYKSDYSKVIRFEAPDPHTFRVYYSEPYSPALSTWASLSILPRHVFEGEDIMNTELAHTPKATLGPYRLAEWNRQQSILMRANPDYFDGNVWISERMIRIIPDPATQFLELTAQKIDQMGLTPIQYDRLFEKRAALFRNYNRYQYLSSGYTYLGFNLQRPPFNDIRVRQAIAFGIDRQELLDGVLLGLGEVIATPYKPGTRWVNETISPRPYNPARAKQLLAQAGWSDSDGDGIVDKEGKPLSFIILTNNGNSSRAATATIIQHRLRPLGIDVKIRLVEWSAFIKNFINKRDFDAVILGWSLGFDPDQYSIWHSSQTGERQFNFLSYSNPKVDAALEAGRTTYEMDERKRQYDLFQQELHHDVPLIFLYAGYSLPVVHKRFYGIDPAPVGIGHNSEFWYVPKPLQKYQTAILP